MKAILTVSMFFCYSIGFCQSTSSTAELTGGISILKQRYTTTFPYSAQIYNGPEYFDYLTRFNTHTDHQFFKYPDKQSGTVTCNEQYYSNLFLSYDLVLDQVIITIPNSPFRLRLVNENVQNFTINNHQFIRIKTDTTQNTVTTGYYEVMTTGNVVLLARHTKDLQKQLRQTKTEAVITNKTRFFLKKNGHFYSTSSNKNILLAFNDHENEIKKYIYNNNLKFNKKRVESYLLTLTKYYNSLTFR